MYRINDRPAAIESVQRYLRVVGSPNIFVAPTGVYDENTRLSVAEFQERYGIEKNGVVDRITFDLLFSVFTFLSEKNRTREGLDSFIDFPLLPGRMSDPMIHINRTLARILDYYGFTHGLMDSNFYSPSTSRAVRDIRKIYMLEGDDLIDEELYARMIADHNSIYDSNSLFN